VISVYTRTALEDPVDDVASDDARAMVMSLIWLGEMVEEGSFRQDLFYRLVVFPITLPPLRERGDDILLLGNHFIKHFGRKYGKDIEGIDPQATEALAKYHWPGNVRELENCIARAIILSKGSHIGLKDLPERIRNHHGQAKIDQDEQPVLTVPDGGISIRDMERELIERTLEKCGGNKTLAANYLAISRKALYEKMKRYGIGI